MAQQQEVQPGWWFTTQWAEVALASAHHMRFREKARPLGKSRPRLSQPPDGLAVAWGSPYLPDLVLYPVHHNAERILTALADLAKADGADDTILERQVQTYNDWHFGQETAQGIAGLLARSTDSAREARKRQAGHPNPAGFFLQRQRTERAAESVREFVSTWGPLVVDFARWLAAGERAGVGRGHPAVEPLWGSPLARLGADALLWPEDWRRWAASIHSKLSLRRDPPFLVPSPVGFYLWAAYLLTALRRHPEWPGCQLFLASRLASMRLLPESLLPRDLTPTAQCRPPTMWLWGELLDYLALAAAYLRQDDAPLGLRVCANPECGETFATAHRGRRYCAKCSNPRVHAIIASRRYRAKRARAR